MNKHMIEVIKRAGNILASEIGDGNTTEKLNPYLTSARPTAWQKVNAVEAMLALFERAAAGSAKTVREELEFSYEKYDDGDAHIWSLNEDTWLVYADLIAIRVTEVETLLNEVMTVAEVADEYGITERGIRATIERGSIPARQSGATWLVRRKDAEARWGTPKWQYVEGARPVIINPHGAEMDYEAALNMCDADIIAEMEHDAVDLDYPEWFAEYAARHEATHGEVWELSKPNPTW